jgi:hypothetical protein
MRENGAASLGSVKIQETMTQSYRETGVGNGRARRTVREKLLTKRGHAPASWAVKLSRARERSRLRRMPDST